MPALGDLEVQVMRRIWARREPVTVRDVLGDLQRVRNIAYTTVMTVMGNLEKKGWLRRHAEGRAYTYEPLVSAEDYSAGLMRQALEASTDRPAPGPDPSHHLDFQVSKCWHATSRHQAAMQIVDRISGLAPGLPPANYLASTMHIVSIRRQRWRLNGVCQ